MSRSFRIDRDEYVTNINVSQVATINELNLLGQISYQEIDVSGTGTFGDLQVTGLGDFAQINVSGTGTFGDLQVTGLGDFAQINVSGTGTFGDLQVTGLGDFTQINVSGTGTFGDLQVTGNLDLAQINVSGTGTFGDLKVTNTTILSNGQINIGPTGYIGGAIFSNSNQSIYVSDETGDDTIGTGTPQYPFKTIDKAIIIVASVPSSMTRPFYIYVSPGLYTIDNSSAAIQLPPQCTLEAPLRYSASIMPTNNAIDMFLMGNHCIVKGFIIRGPTTANVFVATGKSFFGLYDINFSRGKRLLSISGYLSLSTIDTVFINDIFCTNTSKNVFELTNGAHL